jgi:glutamine---fructose-6-phosphate transaminase (isomerizing)
MIRDIPKGFKSTLEALSDFRAEPFSRGPLVFTGNGTAFYSALMGSQILDLSGKDWRAEQAFELVNYERDLRRKPQVAIGVSHSGITKSTVEALSKEKSWGAKTIAVTHFPDRPISKVSDATLVIGDRPDKSRCHTKAYTNSAAGGIRTVAGICPTFGRGARECEEGIRDEACRRIRVDDFPNGRGCKEGSE